MTINEFIASIPAEMLQRGQDYFHNEYIRKLTRNDNGCWYAEVAGNYGDYVVEIESDQENNISRYRCNCPYEGSICKHIAAVVLAIEEKKDGIQTVKGDNTKKDNWTELVKNADADALRRLIVHLGMENHDIRHEIKLAFTKPDPTQNINNIKYYREAIRKIYENYEDYGGYINYRSSFSANRDISDYLTKADNYYEANHLNEAFCIVAAVAMESIEVMERIDDSSGECGGTIIGSFEMVDKILDRDGSKALKESIFNWLDEQARNPDYSDYGVGDNLDPLYFKAAIALKKLDVAKRFVDDRLTMSEQADGWRKEYHSSRYLQYKIDLLQAEGKMAEAEKVIDENLHLEQFRKIRVNEALQAGYYSRAERLILEGINIEKTKNHSGTVRQWKDQLLKLYKQQQETDKYHKLARELFLENTSCMEYYDAYKHTSPQENWELLKDELIAALKSGQTKYYHHNGYSPDLAQIYVKEQMTDELFLLVKTSGEINIVSAFAKHLKLKYTPELLQLYKKGIEKMAVHTGRNIYINIANYLKKMAALEGGVSAAKMLTISLLNEYNNRPAMKDELGKLNWDD